MAGMVVWPVWRYGRYGRMAVWPVWWYGGMVVYGGVGVVGGVVVWVVWLRWLYQCGWPTAALGLRRLGRHPENSRSL